MAISDIVSKVISKYSADVTDHIRGLEKLKGAEREAAQAQIDANKKVQEALQGTVDGINKTTEAIGIAKSAINFAKDSFAAYSAQSKIQAAAGNANIDALRKASAGLKTETELLGDAAKFNSGMFKLSSEQMAIAERAMRALTNRGHDSADAHKKVLEAVTALKVDGLQDLGIVVDKSGLSMENAAHRGQIFKNVMAELTKVSGEVKDGQLSAAEQTQATGIAFQDAMNKMKASIGQMVVALGPLIIKVAELVSAAAGWVAGGPRPGEAGAGKRAMYWAASTLRDSAGGALSLFNPGGNYGQALSLQDYEILREGKASVGFGDMSLKSMRDVYALIGSSAAYSENVRRIGEQYGGAAAGEFGAGNIGSNATAVEALVANLKTMAGMRYSGSEVSWADPKKSGGGGAPKLDATWHQNIDAATLTIGLKIGEAIETIGGVIAGAATQMADDAADDALRASWASDSKFELERFNAMMGNAGKSLRKTGDAMSTGDRYATFNTKRGESKLAEMFGPLEEFNAYKIAFDALAGGVSAAMSAWIDGSASAGKAFKAFIGEAVKGIAVQMAMEALKHGAFAIGSLAFGDFRGAATHGKAAAAFAAGAVVAAAAAKGLHSGSTTPTTGAGAAAPVGGAGGGGQQHQGRQEIVVIGDHSNSPRKQARTTRRRYEEAYGSSGSANR